MPLEILFLGLFGCYLASAANNRAFSHASCVSSFCGALSPSHWSQKCMNQACCSMLYQACSAQLTEAAVEGNNDCQC